MLLMPLGKAAKGTSSLRDALKHFAVFKLMRLFLFSVYKQ